MATDTRHNVVVTHGRHCLCASCAAEDWTRITGPCGMHGKDCPAVYVPIGAPGDIVVSAHADRVVAAQDAVEAVLDECARLDVIRALACQLIEHADRSEGNGHLVRHSDHEALRAALEEYHRV